MMDPTSPQSPDPLATPTDLIEGRFRVTTDLRGSWHFEKGVLDANVAGFSLNRAEVRALREFVEGLALCTYEGPSGPVACFHRRGHGGPHQCPSVWAAGPGLRCQKDQGHDGRHTAGSDELNYGSWDDTAQTARPRVSTDPEENLRVGAGYYAEHAHPPVQEGGYAPGGVVRPAPPSAWADRVLALLRPEISLAAAVAALPEAIHLDEISQDGESHTQEAARALLGVFHRQPVEGWVWVDPVTRAMAQDATTTAERLMQAERLASDARHESGGSPEWHAVVSELLDHLTGGTKQKISIPCPPLDESRSVDHDAEVSARGSAAPEPSGADDPPTPDARPRADRPERDSGPGVSVDRDVVSYNYPGCPNLTMAGRPDRCGLFRSPPTCGPTACGERPSTGVALGVGTIPLGERSVVADPGST